MPQASWIGTPYIKGSSESIRMALLTCSFIGLQFTWGIEMTYCTPYLLQLGLTKSKTSLVWIAGPVSGLIMQPVVGVIADRSKSKWGRRRPFMVGGSLIVGASLLLLGWTSEVVGWFTQDPETKRRATIALAVLNIYVIDFSINAVQASCRSLIVDTLPIPKQQLGSAWATRMVSIGHLIGYVAGSVDLLAIFGKFLGDTQFKQLCVISAVALIASQAITSYAVKERVLVAGRDDPKSGALTMLSTIFKMTKHLPSRIQAICWVQFWAWIGWFPFLFYSTTFIGEVYFRYNKPTAAEQSDDTLGDVGRVGSLSLVIFSLISFAGSIILPWVIKTPDEEKPGFTPRPPASIAPFVSEISKYKPDLVTAWLVSHLVFAASMCLTPFVTSLRFATVLISICGIPWALTTWAPYTEMGIEINRLGVASGSHAYSRRSSYDSNADVEMAHELESSVLRLHHQPDDQSNTSTGELAGIYLGILNLFTTLPQFIGTFISMIVFAILEPGTSPELAEGSPPEEQHSTDGPNGIAVCLFIGALAAVVAAYATSKLKSS